MSPDNYKLAIASLLKCEHDKIFLYWKGRVALYAILKAIGIKEGDEIILPAFTCVVVPNAILYLGAKPIYVDISPETYNMDIYKLEEAITKKTKIIISQNTFGLSSNIEYIIQIAQEYNIYTIEDCTHGFGGFYNGKPNGSYCDAAFYSTQWNKPFSTGIGGFLVVNNESLIDNVKLLESNKIRPSFFEQFILGSLLLFNQFFINRFTYWSLVRFYRILSENNFIIGSNQGDEISDNKIPKKYFKDISSVQIKTGIRQIKKINQVNRLRKKNSSIYTQFLKENKKTFINEKYFNNHLFLRYPIIAKDRDELLRHAKKEKINLGDWFLSPIHPVKSNFELWNLSPENFPFATNISKRILNLPTEIKNTQMILQFLISHLDLLE